MSFGCTVAKFTVACGSVTTAGIAASATLFAAGAAASAVIDAQATANVICGSTVSASAVVCGVTAVATGSGRPGATAYGKTLLKGSVQASATTRINYGGINLGTAKVCGCRQPAVKGVVTISITIITICDHIRTTAPKFCLSEGPAQLAPGTFATTTTLPPVAQCNDQQVAGGDTPDTRLIELGRTSGTFTFDYDTVSIKDRIVVSYQGTTLLDTGCVGESMSKPLTYSGSSTQIMVQVLPNCETGGTGTIWNYTAHCPQ